MCLAVFVHACVYTCVSGEAPDKSIMKVSAAQLAEMASLYRISGQGHTDSVRGPFNTAQTPTARGYRPQGGSAGVSGCF